MAPVRGKTIRGGFSWCKPVGLNAENGRAFMVALEQHKRKDVKDGVSLPAIVPDASGFVKVGGDAPMVILAPSENGITWSSYQIGNELGKRDKSDLAVGVHEEAAEVQIWRGRAPSEGEHTALYIDGVGLTGTTGKYAAFFATPQNFIDGLSHFIANPRNWGRCVPTISSSVLLEDQELRWSDVWYALIVYRIIGSATGPFEEADNALWAVVKTRIDQTLNNMADFFCTAGQNYILESQVSFRSSKPTMRGRTPYDNTHITIDIDPFLKRFFSK